MFNSGFRGRRENDGQGSINPQAQYVQNKYPQPYISGWSISGTDDTSLNPAGGQTVLVNGSGFAAGVSATVGGVQIGSVTLVKPTQISFTAPANSGGSYTLIVYNSTGGAAILVPGLVYSAVPTWTTAAGSIGSYYETTAINSNVVATSDSALTYTLASGSLPPGATLYANGVITGTAPVDSGSTTYTFDITATDAELQDTTRTFTLTINVDVVTWVTPTNGTTYTVPSNVAISNVSLSATDAAGYGIVYSANSLPTGVSLTGNVIYGTPTVGANTSTLLTATANTTGRTATNTINWVVQLGDSYWNLTTLALNSLPTTTPFQSDASLNNASITVAGDTKSSPYNPYQTGYYSNYFDGTGDYLSTTVTNQAPGTGNFTYECWFYTTSLAATRAIMNTRSGDTTDGFDLSVNTSGAIVATYTSTGLFTSTSGVVVPNKWYHIAVVRTLGTTITVYLNGTSLGNFTAGGSTNFTSTTLYVGAGALAGTPMLGYISNFRYTRYAVYNAAFTPGTVPLVPLAGTALLTAQSQRLIDTSPNNFAITKNGDTTAVPANPFATVYDYGTTYYSTYFDGTGDYLTVADNAALQFSTGNFTIECWVYEPDQSGVHNTVIGKWGSGFGTTGDWSLRTRFNSVTQLAFTLKNSTGWYDITTSFSVSNNAWHHIAVVRDSSTTIKLYADGVLKATQAVSSGDIVGSSATLSIGGNSTALGNEGASTGCISNARIVKGQALYTANFTPSTSPLTTTSQGATAGNVSLLTCQSSTLIDNSTNAFAITSNGNARPVPQSPFYSAYYSNYFDGSGDYLTAPSNAAFAFGTGSFTIETWIYNTTTASQQTIVERRGSGFATGDWVLFCNESAGNFTFYAYDVNSASAIMTATGGVANTWTHIAVVRNTNAWAIYINGVSAATTTSSATIADNSQVVSVGKDLTAGIRFYFSGYISNLRITKGQALYTTNFTPATSPLTTTSQGATAANVSLLTCQSLYFIDNSTNAFAITVNGNTAVATVAPFTQPSQYSATTAVATYGSGYFDGSGDYLTVANNAANSVGTGDFTLECWAYPTALSGSINKSLLTQGVNSGYTFYLNTTNNLVLGNYGVVAALVTSSSTVSTGSWYHLAATRSGTSLKLFINGVVVGTATDSTNFAPATNSLFLGGNGNYTTDVFSGYISNIRIIKGTALYTANFQPGPTPLTAVTNTQILTLQYNGGSNNSQFRDGSNFQNLITRNGNATQGTFTPFSATGWSGYFDSSNYIYAASNAAFAPGTGDFTVEAWVYPTAAYTTYNYVLGVAVTGGLVFYVTSGNLVVRAYNVADQLSSATIPSLYTWTHVAASRSGTTLRIFVNGTQTATTTNSYNFVQGAAYIGNDSTNAAPWYGYISNFRFVKGQALYTTTFTPATSPLTTTSQSATAGNVSLLTLQSPSFIDNSANRFTITTAGSVKTQSFSPFSGVTTTPYYSNYFDGSGDYLSLASNAAFNFSTGDFTVEAWVYPTSLATDWFVISATGAGGLFVGYAASIGFGWGRTAVAWDYRPGTLTANTWQHVVVARSGTSMYVFVNGTQAGTTQSLSTAYNLGATATTVGSQGANYYLTGYISNLRVTKGQALYTANFTPATSPLTTTSQSATAANVSLLTCQTSTFIDNSTNAFAITVNGNAIPTTIAPFAATSTTGVSYTTSVNGGSAYFDGTGDYVLTASTPALGTSDWTAECWFYPTALAGYGQVMGMRMNVSSGPNQYVPIYIQYGTGTGTFLFLSSTTGSSWNITSGSSFGTCTTGQWFHIAVCRSGSSIYGFLNGVKKFTVNISTNSYSSTNPWHVGGNSGGDNSIGYISNCRYVIGTAIYTAAFSPPTAPPVPTAATVVLLSGTNGSIIDYTGKNDLETVGDARLAPQNPYGGSYYSVYSASTSDYVTAPSAAWTTMTGQFTVECWMYYVAAPSAGWGVGGSTNGAFIPWYYNGSFFGPNIYGSGNIFTSSAAPLVGQWFHIAVTRNASNLMTMWFNGVSVGSATNSSTFTQGVWAFHVGGNGYISNMRMVSGSCLYTTTFTPSTTPLTAVSGTQILTCQSSTFKDNSTNAYTITRGGSASVNSINPFQNNGTYSMYFDGTGDYLVALNSPGFAFGTGDFTVECWVYCTTFGANGFLVLDSRPSGSAAPYTMGVTVTGLPYIYDGSTITSGSSGITLNSWAYLTWCRSSSTLKMFVNGVSVYSASYTSSITGTGSLTIGGLVAGGAGYFLNGYMTDLRITKYARYTTTFTPPTSTFQTK